MARAHLIILLACVLACQSSEFDEMKDFITKFQQEHDDVYPVLSGELSPFVSSDNHREKRSVMPGEASSPLMEWITHKIKANAMSRNRCPAGTIRYLHICLPIKKLLARRRS